MFTRKLLFLLVAMALVTTGGLWAQGQTGEIIGTVVLEDGSALPGVTVIAESPNMIGKKTTLTNENGVYRLLALPRGQYVLIFELEGHRTIKRTKIEVSIGKTYKVDAMMQPGKIEEKVEVIGRAPTIDVRKSATAVNISKEVFTKLPKGRNFLSVVTTSAGLNAESEFVDGTNVNGRDSNLSFDGASASENTFYVDGVDTTTLFTGTQGQNVNVDFIEEVQVNSSGFAAEFGGSMGGVINVVTRSGGNEFSGSVNLYYDSSWLDGKPRDLLGLNPLNTAEAEYYSYPEDSWSRIEPGFGLGGFIIKDKIWFFASFMPKFETTTRDGEFIADPSANGEFTRKDSTYRGSLKLTFQLSNNLRISLGGTLDWFKWRQALPFRDGSSNPDYPYAEAGYDYPAYTVSGALDYNLGNNTMIHGTVGFYRSNEKSKLGPDGPRYFHLRPGPDGLPAGFMNYTYEDGYQLIKNIADKLTATFDLTHYLNAGGEHMLKTGVQLVKVGADINNAYPYDYNRFYWGEDYYASDGTLHPTTLGYVEVRDPFGTLAKISSTRIAAYLQDTWTIGDKFTLNFGVRIEKEDIPSFSDLPEYDYPPIKFGFFDKVAPRIGFAYDVFGDSSLKLFGSFGIYYDVMKLAMAQGSYGGFKWESSYYDLVSTDWNLSEQDHPVTGGLNGGQYFETRNWRKPSFDTTQPDMKPYSKGEITFGVEKRLTEDISINARFLHNYIMNAIEDIGVLVEGSEMYYNGNPGSDWIQEKYLESQALGLIPQGVEAVKAKRVYTSVQLSLDKRFSNNWMAGASVLWSRLAGNFAGLSSSDEHGRKDPSVQRYFDSWFMHRDQNMNVEDGPLVTNRPWQFKVYGAYTFDFGLTVGLNAFAMSGSPVSSEFYLNGMQGWYPFGRGDIGDTPMLWRADVYLEQNIKLSEKVTLQLNANITNVTNNDIAQRVYGLMNRNAVYMAENAIWNGGSGFDVNTTWGQYGSDIGKSVTWDPRYRMKLNFQAPIAVRLGARLLF